MLLPFLFFSMVSGLGNPKKEDRIWDESYSGGLQGSGIKILYPGNGTIFPPEMAAPLFQWKDSLQLENKFRISLSTENGKDIISQSVIGKSWRPDSVTWEAIKSKSIGRKVTFSINPEGIESNQTKTSTGKMDFSFSRDSVNASVFYRAVPLPFSYAIKNVREIEWYMGSIKGGRPKKILDNIPVCANCHSFSKDGTQFAMDVDYANDKGSYIISEIEDTLQLTFDKIITWSDYKREDGENTFGLLSSISPDGHYVLSTVKDRSIFVPVDNLEYSQLFFPIKGILAVYDRDKKKFYELPGADNSALVQSNPNWSPDGKEIMFTRASRYVSDKIDHSNDIMVKVEDASEFTIGHKDFKFDLYQLDFNNGKGGTAQPVAGASGNGKSNYFARYSPDGKWVVFCQSKNYMLLQPDSKLYIMPANGGIAREMNCNTNKMNSWHSWSPNGKWLVFSSKKNGPYTQLYLTHIDENGNDSPAVLLENMVFEKKAANIPEFYDDRKRPFNKMKDAFSKSALYYNRLANDNITNFAYQKAMNNLDLAIKSDGNYYDAYLSRIMLNIHLGNILTQQFKDDGLKARTIINQQILKNPQDQELLLKRSNLNYFMGADDEALNDALAVVQQDPKNFDGNFVLASIYRKKGELAKTFATYETMLKLRPEDKQIMLYLGNLYQKIGRTDQALTIYSGLISKYPDEAGNYITRGSLLQTKGDAAGAKADFDKVISLKPKSYEGYQKRALYFAMNGKKTEAQADLNKALTLLTLEIANSPEQIDLFFRHAEMVVQNGDLKAALEDAEKILKIAPGNFNALKLKGSMFQSMHQWQNSIDTHTHLINDFPKEADFYSKRGFAYLNLGNKEMALADLARAQTLSPQDQSILYNLAMMKKSMGDAVGAKKDLQKILTILIDKQKKGKLNEAESKMLNMVTEQMKQG